MLRNYLTIAGRNLLRNRTYGVLTLLGLASGMACAILLGLYIYDELTFDQYHANTANIYRLTTHVKWGDNDLNMGIGSAPMAPALRREYPEISNVLRVKPDDAVAFRVGSKAVYARHVIYADSSLFSFFDYAFLDGRPQSALRSPNGVVLTRKLALSLFGRTDGLLGRVVRVKDDQPLTVTGVLQDVPGNHHLTFDAVLPYANRQLNPIDPTKWDGFNSATYVLLHPNGDVRRLDRKMPAFYKKYIAQAIGDDADATQNVTFTITFQPLADMHLHSTHLLGVGGGNEGGLAYVYTFSAIALFILLIAIVNYVNLATARSAGRAREIGVRKAVGSLRSQLVGQFLTESILLTLLALVVSLGLVSLLLPLFNAVAAKTLTLDLGNVKLLGLFLGFGLLIGLVSGLYPAFVLARFNPVTVLKGSFTSNGKGLLLRQSLVVMQFTVSIAMIVGTFVVYRQLQFMRHTQLGFNQEQVIVLSLGSPSGGRSVSVLKEKLLQHPAIKSASLTSGSVGGDMNNKTTFSFYRADGKEQAVSTEYFSVDPEFLDVLQIGLKEGRNFSSARGSDSTDAVLVNEAMLRRLGWKNRGAGLIEVNTRRVPITGIIRDFHLRSLRNKIEPLVLVLRANQGNRLLIRVTPQNIPTALTYVEQTYKALNPNQPFEYTFLDQSFSSQYRSDERKGNLFLGFSGMAIFIACLGLFGLATFTAQQRTKEIGIRKMLGASVAGITLLLSKDFLKLVLIAILIASPLAYYAMNRWLADYAYRVALSWWVFAGAGGLAVGIALLTVSFQSIRTALVNPVKSLRSE